MIRLLFDMGLPRRSADDLTALGWDSVHIGALGHHRATDAAILALAAEQGRTVVTLDADFSRLLALGGMRRPSVIFLRQSELDRPAATALLRAILPLLDQALDEGALAVVTTNGIRVRRLPLLGEPSPRVS
jgi:predicted nuclease of predicted toxin-antitoxin system